jgi:hypothetical protein
MSNFNDNDIDIYLKSAIDTGDDAVDRLKRDIKRLSEKLKDFPLILQSTLDPKIIEGLAKLGEVSQQVAKDMGKAIGQVAKDQLKEQQKAQKELDKMMGNAYDMMVSDLAKRAEAQKKANDAEIQAERAKQQKIDEMQRQRQATASRNLETSLQDRVKKLNAQIMPANGGRQASYVLNTDSENNLTSAILTWTDGLDRVRKAFYEVQTVINKVGESQQRLVLTGKQYVDNVEQRAKKIDALEATKDNFRNGLSTLTKDGVLSSSDISNLNSLIDSLSAKSKTYKQDIVEVRQEYQKIKDLNKQLLADKAEEEARQKRIAEDATKITNQALQNSLQRRVNKINDQLSASNGGRVTSYNISTDPTDGVTRATIAWEDGLGRVRKAFYEIQELLDKNGNLQQKLVLTGKQYLDNVEKTSKLISSQNITQTNLGKQLTQLRDTGVVDTAPLDALQQRIDALNIGARGYQKEVNNIKNTIKDLKQEQSSTLALERETQNLFTQITNLRDKLETTSSPIKHTTAIDDMKQKYQSLLDYISAITVQGRAMNEQEIEYTQVQNKLLDQQIEKQKIIEQQTSRQNRAGFVPIGSVPQGLDLHPSNEKALKQSVIDTINRSQDDSIKEFTNNMNLATDAITRFKPSVESGNYLHTFEVSVKNINGTTSKMIVTLDQATGTFRRFSDAVTNTSGKDLGFFKQLEVAISRIPVWMVGMTAFYQSLHFFTEGVKYVNELNGALTQISTATNKSQADVAELGKTFQKTAMEIGVTTKDLTAGALEFYRQGLGDKDVLDRLKTTTEYAKISGLDFKQSAELLTASTNSMNVDIHHVADSFTYLGREHCPLVA